MIIPFQKNYLFINDLWGEFQGRVYVLIRNKVNKMLALPVNVTFKLNFQSCHKPNMSFFNILNLPSATWIAGILLTLVLTVP